MRINRKIVGILGVIIVEMFGNRELKYLGIIIKRRINEILIFRKRYINRIKSVSVKLG